MDVDRHRGEFGVGAGLHLGPWPTLSLADSREKCREARKTIAAGLDPVLEKKRARITAKFSVATSFKEVEPDGTWIVAPDHLARAEAYERAVAHNNPVAIETLSMQPLERLSGHDGVTWLDRELPAAKPASLGRGFGAEVRTALVLRQQWLVEQELAQTEGDRVRLKPNAVARLQQRELTRVAGQISRELGLHYVPATGGGRIEGKLGRAVQIGDRKFALIEKSGDLRGRS